MTIMTRIRWFVLALAGAVVVLAIAGPSIAQAGGGCHSDTTAGQGTRVDLRAACFGPTLLHVHAGDIVTWVNRDSMAHTVTGVNASWGDYSELAEGESVSHEFATAGTYPYYCLLHPSMIGAVIVEDGEGAIDRESVSLVSSGGEQRASLAASNGAGHGRTIGFSAAIAIAGVVAGAGGFALGRRRSEG